MITSTQQVIKRYHQHIIEWSTCYNALITYQRLSFIYLLLIINVVTKKDGINGHMKADPQEISSYHLLKKII